nr:MAG TPA: hypothetical protein [Caudoviricetes sp.]
MNTHFFSPMKFYSLINKSIICNIILILIKYIVTYKR